MAKYRPKIRPHVKRALVAEAGEKCANPGCLASQVHIHHIQEWAVYCAHDEAHMIAICPNCHDAVHRGALRIDDETLYRWKDVERIHGPRRDHLWVDARPAPKLLLGTITVATDNSVWVFDLTNSLRLGFRVEDGELQLISLALSTYRGEEVVRVLDNRVKYVAAEPVRYDSRPGRIHVTAPANDNYLPFWAFRVMRGMFPEYPKSGNLVLLDLEVIRPALVRVEGVWAERHRAFIVTPEAFCACNPGLDRPVALVGDGEASILHWNGPVGAAMFD